MNTEQLNKKCLSYIGCYFPDENKIYIAKKVPLTITSSITYVKTHFPYKCKNNVNYSDIYIFHLWVWFHEQGHHFDHKLNRENSYTLTRLHSLLSNT